MHTGYFGKVWTRQGFHKDFRSKNIDLQANTTEILRRASRKQRPVRKRPFVTRLRAPRAHLGAAVPRRYQLPPDHGRPPLRETCMRASSVNDVHLCTYTRVLGRAPASSVHKEGYISIYGHIVRNLKTNSKSCCKTAFRLVSLRGRPFRGAVLVPSGCVDASLSGGSVYNLA